MSTDVQKYLLTVDDSKSDAAEIAAETVKKLESKETSLIDVVQSLGEYINEQDVTIRSKAVSYLAAVIAALPPRFLNRQQIQVLCQFFCDRIEDGGALGGLLGLQALDRFNEDMAVMIVRAMFDSFQDLQLRPQGQRYQILQLLNELMSNHRKAIRDLGKESLVGVTDLVSGEKDPRNLMVVFSILKVIMAEWDITDHEETLFHSVYCYFPITFRPPSDDPYRITAQDLKDRLRDCIASRSQFAPHTFPNMIDKLDSTSPNVKKDCLHTITACALSYDVAAISRYSITLWDSLKFEILNAQSEELAEEALIALRAIAVRLSDTKTPESDQSFLAQYLHPITKECMEELQEVQQKKVKQLGQILGRLCSASAPAFLLIEKGVVPFLLTIYQDNLGEILKERVLLEVFVQFFESAIEVFGSWKSIPSHGNAFTHSPLGGFKDRLFEIFSQALMGSLKEEVSFRVIAIKGLLLMSKLRHFFEDDEIGMIVQYCNDISLVEESYGNDDIKKEAIQCLANISTFKPTLIMDITFPAFMAKLPDSDTGGDKQYLTTLEGLALISVEKDISETLIRRLLNKLDVILRGNARPTYAHAVLSTILYVLDKRKEEEDPNLHSYYDRIIVGLIRKTVLPTIGQGSLTALNDPAVMEILGQLCNLVIHRLRGEKQDAASKEIYTLFSGIEGFTPVPLCGNYSSERSNTMILSTYLLAALRPDVDLTFSQEVQTSITDLLRAIVTQALNTSLSTSPSARLFILRHLALIINKFLLSSSLSLAENLLWEFDSGLLTLIEDPLKAEACIRPIFWIAKALLLRLHQTEKLLSSLMDLLKSDVYGATAARGFTLLLSPDPILSRSNGATIRLLAPQKIFTICAPGLESLFRSTTDPTIKPNYLIALSGLLRYVSSEIMMQQLGTLLPLLLQSLELEEVETKGATVETLIVIVRENPGALEEHAQSLITRLLKISSETKKTPPSIRRASLGALTLFPMQLSHTVLLPYKRSVDRSLLTILDDPRRDVRRQAVDCRAKWLGMDDPKDIDED
ncbi:MAG: hypothetical protein M1834_004408 [Cirrosporium novae-zelandiae]|nr:MAG: hypothetical protein M1834_004408 [Cirrosporium novae-zelandiae]